MLCHKQEYPRIIFYKVTWERSLRSEEIWNEVKRLAFNGHHWSPILQRESAGTNDNKNLKIHLPTYDFEYFHSLFACTNILSCAEKHADYGSVCKSNTNCYMIACYYLLQYSYWIYSILFTLHSFYHICLIFCNIKQNVFKYAYVAVVNRQHAVNMVFVFQFYITRWLLTHCPLLSFGATCCCVLWICI